MPFLYWIHSPGARVRGFRLAIGQRRLLTSPLEHPLSGACVRNMKWLDGISLYILVPVAVFLGLAPFTPEPHLWQKTRMLMEGTLTRPLDIFDLLFHAAPLVLLTLKLLRSRHSSS